MVTRRELCVELFRNHAKPIVPESAGVAPILPQLSGIRSVVFDVYGTLFSSASGDIGLIIRQDTQSAFLSALNAVGCAPPYGTDVSSVFYETIRRDHERKRANGVEYPEVKIDLIWADVAKEIGCCPDRDENWIDRLAVEYEVRLNPVAPMPDAREALAYTRSAVEALGIVSNAQFFTPYLFDAYLKSSVEELGFDPRLCVWSYLVGKAKPSIDLFASLVEALFHDYSISPEQTLYIGNDMLNDVYTAAKVGCRTALFAGDARSLRFRSDRVECSDLKPDAVLTEWNQLAEIIR